MRFPISDQYQPRSYLAPFGDTVIYNTLVEKIIKIANFYPPQSHKSPSHGVTPFEFRDEPDISRNYNVQALGL